MKLTYWTAPHPSDSDRYSIRSKTKKGAAAQIAVREDAHLWEAPHKCTVEYNDAFDLMTRCLEVDSGYWEQ